jgi:charged multivesicular body protein 1
MLLAPTNPAVETYNKMGNSQKKLDDTLFNLRLSSKQMMKESQRANKEEAAEKIKAKKALEKGMIDTARIHAENAIRKKNDSLNFMRLSSKLDAVASKVQTATRTENMTREFSKMLPQLDRVLQNLNVENVSQTMGQFETMFENLDVATGYVSDSLQQSTAVAAPRQEVDGLLSQIASENNIAIEEQFGELASGAIGTAPVREQEAKSKVDHRA